MELDDGSERWRVGRKLGRTLYEGEQLVGMMDSVALAARVVAAMNERDEALAQCAALRAALMAMVEEFLMGHDHDSDCADECLCPLADQVNAAFARGGK